MAKVTLRGEPACSVSGGQRSVRLARVVRRGPVNDDHNECNPVNGATMGSLLLNKGRLSACELSGFVSETSGWLAMKGQLETGGQSGEGA